MTNFFTLALALSISFLSTAQNSKIYHSLKYAMFTEASFAPVGVVDVTETEPENWGDPMIVEPVYGKTFGGITLLSYIYTFRVNAYDFNEDLALGINVAPSAGITLSEFGYGSVNLPAFASINFGAGSTYDTFKDNGGYFGLGYEYNFTNIIKSDEGGSYYADKYPEMIDRTYNWGQMMLIGGFRWWSKAEKLQEVSLKYGIGSNGSDVPEAMSKEHGRPWSIQLAYGLLLNY